MDTPLLRYPKKSHRKIINIPSESFALAEFLGIVLGDGGINNNWQLIISLNSILDVDYSIYIVSLIKKLFNIVPATRKRPNQNTLVIVASSTTLVENLIERGAVRGNKILQMIDIPSWIKSNMEYKKAFVRGLVDTDGCLFIHKHRIKNVVYENIGFCFTSFSEHLINSVANILLEFGIQPHIHKNKQHIYLYSEKAIVRYLNIFGSSNTRIYQKYASWRDARVV
ncbi:MAG TPA: LAGLIDADG family homing endonuclease [Candidatus Saccharimonadales bacterium]|nr:LAGLIDADG family homing endonuclease [Candidatus Saccharimonadales bacterium]